MCFLLICIIEQHNHQKYFDNILLNPSLLLGPKNKGNKSKMVQGPEKLNINRKFENELAQYATHYMPPYYSSIIPVKNSNI